MAIDVSVLEVATQFTELLNRVRKGEEVTIVDAGMPVARLLPVFPKSPRIPGQDIGKVIIESDFDHPLPEDIINDFLNPATG